MHEAALLRDLVREVEEVAARDTLVRVVRVRVRVGALSHLTAAGIRDGWPDAVRGTRAEDARLEVEESDDLDDPGAGGVVLVEVVGGEGAPVGTRTVGKDQPES